MALRVLAPAARPLVRAIALGPSLLTRAVEEQAPQLTASLIDEGPTVVLGALQRRSQVVDRASVDTTGTTVLRRATTGTTVYLRGRALVFTLAMPALATLAPDTTARTLLNRNVRGFLDGFRRAGVMAHYFGREWITLGKRPAAILGFEVLPGGGTLIEVFAGVDEALALPDGIATAAERGLDRAVGKAPAALIEVMWAVDPFALAAQVIATIAARAGGDATAMDEPVGAEATPAPLGEDDSAPPEARFAAPVRAPIGWVEAAIVPATGQLWLGGDLLAATFAVRSLAEAIAGGATEPRWSEGDAPLDGAREADLIEAARRARGLGGQGG